jgi:ectoine hydroxylase-related dioxygenase (phytanoyl-CoA dioxygenase family)
MQSLNGVTMDGGLVSPEERAVFARDGVVCLRGAFALRWLEVLAEGIERNMREPSPDACRYTPDGAPGAFYDDYCNWSRIPEYRAFAFDSPVAAIAAALMGAREVRLFHEHVLIKEPGTREVTPWHHDQPYYCVDGDQLCSIWLPLDPVPRIACPEFVAGSHGWGKLFHPRHFVNHQGYAATGVPYEPVPDIDARRGEFEILSWDMAPGDCLVFHMRTLHGAPGTATLKTRRRGFSTRWMGEDAVFAVRPVKTSPPFPEVQLAPGDPMRHPSFPLVWRA